MRVVIQRVKKASVTVDGQVIGQIKKGYCIFVGLKGSDTKEIVHKIAKKCANLRIFEDEDHKMNLGLKEVEGSILSISQFTLYGLIKKGNRPNFTSAMAAEEAKKLYDDFNEELKSYGYKVESGVFGAMMDVDLVNDGPTTILMDSDEW